MGGIVQPPENNILPPELASADSPPPPSAAGAHSSLMQYVVNVLQPLVDHSSKMERARSGAEREQGAGHGAKRNATQRM